MKLFKALIPHGAKLNLVLKTSAVQPSSFAHTIIYRRLNFVQRFTLHHIPLPLRSLDWVMPKHGQQQIHAPQFTITPRMTLTISPMIKMGDFVINLTGSTHYQYPAVVYNQKPLNSPVNVMAPVVQRVMAIERIVRQQAFLKTINFPLLVGNTPPLFTRQPVTHLIYRQHNDSATPVKRERQAESFTRSSLPIQTTVAAAVPVYLKRFRASQILHDIMNPVRPHVTNHSSSIVNRGFHIKNIHQTLTRILSHSRSTDNQPIKFSQSKAEIEQPIFAPLKRAGVRRVEQLTEKTALSLRKPPNPSLQTHDSKQSIEMVIKKVNKIENQESNTTLQRTITENVNRQIEETLNTQLQNKIAINPKETRWLEENLYSRLINRMVLEKERMEY